MRLMAEKAIEGGNSNSAVIVLIGADTATTGGDQAIMTCRNFGTLR
jgi:hypothetical protein